MTTQTKRHPGWLALAFFITLTLIGGITIGIVTAPGDWYASLSKPPFNPPNWVFGPVWTTLYIMIGFAGWRAWLSGDTILQRLWWTQLALNFLWSPVFFGAHMLGLGLIVILAMLASILIFIAKAWHRAPVAAWLFIPYAFWVAFATFLNASLLILNG